MPNARALSPNGRPAGRVCAYAPNRRRIRTCQPVTGRAKELTLISSCPNRSDFADDGIFIPGDSMAQHLHDNCCDGPLETASAAQAATSSAANFVPSRSRARADRSGRGECRL